MIKMEYIVEIFGHTHFILADNIYEAVRSIAKRYTAQIPRWYVTVKVAIHGMLIPYIFHIRQIDGNIEIHEETEEERRIYQRKVEEMKRKERIRLNIYRPR